MVVLLARSAVNRAAPGGICKPVTDRIPEGQIFGIEDWPPPGNA